MQALRNVEPAIWFSLIRAILYIGGGAIGVALDPDLIEPILIGVGGALGVDAATTAATRAKVYSPATASDMLAQVFTGQVGDFIKRTVGGIVPEGKFTEGLRAVLPIMMEFSQAQLTDDTRADLQRRIHVTLRAAGLTPKRTIPPIPTSILFVLVMVLISACAPAARFAGDVLDEATGDGAAQLVFVQTGLEFQPGDGTAVGVNVDILGRELAIADPLCTPTIVVAEPTPAMPLPLLGSSCLLGDLTEPYAIVLSGVDVDATASWRRPGSSRIYHDVAE